MGLLLQEATDAAVAEGALGALMGTFALMWLVIVLLILVGIAITLWALYSIWTGKNETNWKLLWTLVVLVVGLIGLIIYYFIGKKERVA